MRFKKDYIPWNKDKTGGHLTEKHRRKISETLKGKIPWNKGKHPTEETRRKMSEAHRGNQNALGWHHTAETRCKLSKIHKGQVPWIKGKQHTLETKRKNSEASKRLWQDPDYVRKLQIAIKAKPNRAERKLDAILQEVCPKEFALNVRGEVMVLGGKIPDFVNMNGKKQLIELYGDYWHDPKRFPERQSPQERIDYFKQFGDWETLIIWERELKDEAKLKQKLLAFMGR